MFSATLDPKTCPTCAGMDGTIFNFNGSVVKGPLWAKFPPIHYNCRCYLTPITKTWQELGLYEKDLSKERLASFSGEYPKVVDYKSWFAHQSEEVKREILGPSRYKLYYEGKLESFDDLLGRGGKIRTLKELKMLYSSEEAV